MANALSSIAGPPPAPNPDPVSSIGSGQVPNALASGAPQGQGASPQQMPPPPSHQQTVAALRHFGSIEKELTALLSDPDLGKSDLQSKIIDGATKLVAQGILTPTQAVTQLKDVPERPYDQKVFIQKAFVQNTQAQTSVLAHRQMGVASGMVQDTDTDDGSSNDHQGHIASLMANYKGSNGNAR
jgi:hypothetical protein